MADKNNRRHPSGCLPPLLTNQIYYQNQRGLRYDDLFAQHQLVAGIVDRPVLRLARAVAFHMVDHITELAFEGAEQHAVAGVVRQERFRFLDRIATHILAFEGDSQVVFFDGNYSEYEANKKMRLGDVEPKRFKYKKLME